MSEEVSQPSRPTRGAKAAAVAETEEAVAVVEAEMVEAAAAEPEHEGDQEVVATKSTRGRATRASAVSKEETGDAGGDEDGSSPTRKSTRARK